MILSVWEPIGKRFAYYEVADTSGKAHTPPARHVRSSAPLGASPEDAAWPLPAGARLVGHGAQAKGRIAVRPTFGPMGDVNLPGGRALWIAGGFALAALLARRSLR